MGPEIDKITEFEPVFDNLEEAVDASIRIDRRADAT